MSKIYISEKTLIKLSDPKINQNYLKAFKGFDIEHSKPKQPQIKPKQSKPSNKIRYVTLNVLKQPPKKSKKLIPQRKALMGDITEHRYTAPVKQSTTFFYSPSFKNHNSAAAFKKGKEMKNPRIRINYLKEHHLLAGESAQMIKDPKRQYIKTKTKNVSTIQRAKKHKKTKPDWTDRFALK